MVLARTGIALGSHGGPPHGRTADPLCCITHLGPLVKEFRAAWWMCPLAWFVTVLPILLVIVIGLLAPLGALVLRGAAGGPGSALIPVGLALLAAPSALSLCRELLVNAQTATALYRDGFAIATARGLRSWRWAEIRKVVPTRHETGSPERPHVAVTYSVVMRDGGAVDVTDEEAGEEIRTRLARSREGDDHRIELGTGAPFGRGESCRATSGSRARAASALSMPRR